MISDKEREVIRLVKLGKTNQEIATEMNLSIDTIAKHYMARIYKRMGITGNLKTGKRKALMAWTE